MTVIRSTIVVPNNPGWIDDANKWAAGMGYSGDPQDDLLTFGPVNWEHIGQGVQCSVASFAVPEAVSQRGVGDLSVPNFVPPAERGDFLAAINRTKSRLLVISSPTDPLIATTPIADQVWILDNPDAKEALQWLGMTKIPPPPI